ncbi:hypothetical protein NIES2111_65500 (plasmid) [Nostoc sp. NIES-2111]|nr:hypothetical protein NIES2111_65500 [Nostoc sp. NIES-2111]
MDSEQLSLNIQLESKSPQQKPVECLGITFASDEERRSYFTEKLREKLQDAKFRQIEGFPIGEDEDILALSDPPYYTACPNPFIEDFINYWHHEKDNNSAYDIFQYHREPFAADVSEGKNDPIYNAHSYHTKVPHKAIMRYILHYTEPGDIVFDGFCGTGMTGVAAQLCGDKATVESLGYKVLADGTILDEDGKTFSKLGARRVILSDLSPAATFIAYNYNMSVDVAEFEREAKRILFEVEKECSWMYLTLHKPTSGEIEKAVTLLTTIDDLVEIRNYSLPFGKINYIVYSDVFICSECSREVIFWEAAVDKQAGSVFDIFPCPHCNAKLSKRNMDRIWVTRFDSVINQTIKQAKQVPVLVNYKVGNKNFDKTIDAFDLALIEKIETSPIYEWYPTNLIPEGEKTRDPFSIGISHLHHFFTIRNLSILSILKKKITNNKQLTSVLWFWLNAAKRYLSRLSKLGTGYYFKGGGGAINAGVLGTLFIPSFSVENSILKTLEIRLPKLINVLRTLSNSSFSVVEVRSSTKLAHPSNSVDYIFIDPPFGGNLMYSELNLFWEGWLKVITNNQLEAIENKYQGKGLTEYQELMCRAFQEFYRILKYGHWITVEFHNSKNSVWNAIQEALQSAGFVIADVRTLDKKQVTFNQVAGGGSVKQDLVISAYKPTNALEERFQLEAGTEEACWQFIRNHLQQLPVFVAKNGSAETIAERQNYLLFDRMVAFHIQRGFTVPLSASEFYAGLAQRFTERDEMYFLPEQVAEYERKRITVKELLQLELIVNNEETAVQWLKQQLTKKPQTFQEIHPQFMLSKSAWSKAETPLELSELLEQNFLRYEGKGTIPKQIVSWLKQSSIHRDKIHQIEESLAPDAVGLETDDPVLIIAAKDKWYVPDPNQAIDLEKLRLKSLLREFEEYHQSKQKKLKVFRLEAVRAGFKKAWQERNYQIIVDVAKKIPENVLQEDQKLIMLYDNAFNRLEE